MGKVPISGTTKHCFFSLKAILGVIGAGSGVIWQHHNPKMVLSNG